MTSHWGCTLRAGILNDIAENFDFLYLDQIWKKCLQQLLQHVHACILNSVFIFLIQNQDEMEDGIGGGVSRNGLQASSPNILTPLYMYNMHIMAAVLKNIVENWHAY